MAIFDLKPCEYNINKNVKVNYQVKSVGKILCIPLILKVVFMITLFKAIPSFKFYGSAPIQSKNKNDGFKTQVQIK